MGNEESIWTILPEDVAEGKWTHLVKLVDTKDGIVTHRFFKDGKMYNAYTEDEKKDG